MKASRPRYVLIAETETVAEGLGWRFALHGANDAVSVVASDRETGADADRLALLALVRGLEALDQPSAVIVVTRCSTLLRGLSRGLEQWRNNHWRWERHGRQTPIRDADLWRRVDRSLRFHEIKCRSWRANQPGRIDSVRTDPFHAPTGVREPVTQPHRLWIDGRFDAPAMVVVRNAASRRRVRLAEPAVA